MSVLFVKSLSGLGMHQGYRVNSEFATKHFTAILASPKAMKAY